MRIRKLARNEHVRTRTLWEETFLEDSSGFLDYYYTEKAKDNEIYVMEDKGEIVSMIHLNPYEVRVGERIYPIHYIVAVATKKEYRRRGIMRLLMKHVLRMMKDRGELFTFLMTENEAIYAPFDFEVICEQRQVRIRREELEMTDFETEYAEAKDATKLAGFANEILRKYQVVTWRNTAYYERLLLELQSEKGGIMLFRRKGKLEGILGYTNEGDFVTREILFREEKYIDSVGEIKSVIMARILNENPEIDLKKLKVFLNEEV